MEVKGRSNECRRKEDIRQNKGLAIWKGEWKKDDQTG